MTLYYKATHPTTGLVALRTTQHALYEFAILSDDNTAARQAKYDRALERATAAAATLEPAAEDLQRLLQLERELDESWRAKKVQLGHGWGAAHDAHYEPAAAARAAFKTKHLFTPHQLRRAPLDLADAAERLASTEVAASFSRRADLAIKHQAKHGGTIAETEQLTAAEYRATKKALRAAAAEALAALTAPA